MAKGENPVLETLADINLASVERTELDPASLILVRLAALVAVDAPVSSYLLHLGPAAETGVTLDQAQKTPGKTRTPDLAARHGIGPRDGGTPSRRQ